MKKSLQTWISNKSNMKPKKNWSIFFSSLSNSGDFLSLKLRLENPCMLWCWNAMFVSHKCLLVGYYKSSDQSNKVVQFSTTFIMIICLVCTTIILFFFLFAICVFMVSRVATNSDKVSERSRLFMEQAEKLVKYRTTNASVVHKNGVAASPYLLL